MKIDVPPGQVTRVVGDALVIQWERQTHYRAVFNIDGADAGLKRIIQYTGEGWTEVVEVSLDDIPGAYLRLMESEGFTPHGENPEPGWTLENHDIEREL